MQPYAPLPAGAREAGAAQSKEDEPPSHQWQQADATGTFAM